MRVGLVLGAGGTVGIAYHAGVLRALEEVGGFVPDSADLVVGTSAGSFAAAYVRAGWSTADAWHLILGTHPEMAALTAEEHAANRAGILAPVFRDPADLLRRWLGSVYMLGRSVARVPLPLPPPVLRHAFPGGMFAMAEGRRRFAAELPEAWPEKKLWLCAVNIVTGRRVVLGKRSDPEVSLHDAVAASCAIPGLYQPVRVGKATLVDGGVHSTTNLDLASRDRCDLIIGIAPMAYDPKHAPAAHVQLGRRLPARALVREAAEARSRGSRVLLLSPTADELRVHGANLMRRTGWDLIARAAYEAAARRIGTAAVQRMLSGDAAA